MSLESNYHSQNVAITTQSFLSRSFTVTQHKCCRKSWQLGFFSYPDKEICTAYEDSSICKVDKFTPDKLMIT